MTLNEPALEYVAISEGLETAADARERITEVIELADHDVLDVARSRAAEQEVLDLLDEPPAR